MFAHWRPIISSLWPGDFPEMVKTVLPQPFTKHAELYKRLQDWCLVLGGHEHVIHYWLCFSKRVDWCRSYVQIKDKLKWSLKICSHKIHKILEDCRVAVTVTWRLVEIWWDLKKVLAACKPKNISELETIVHEEWDMIPQECFQKLVSGYASYLAQVITKKSALLCTKDACHDGVK